jgi:hypothetical protein
MDTIEEIAKFLTKTLGVIDKWIEDPTRRQEARMEVKENALDLVTKIIKEADPHEADKMLAKFIDLTSGL